MIVLLFTQPVLFVDTVYCWSQQPEQKYRKRTCAYIDRIYFDCHVSTARLLKLSSLVYNHRRNSPDLMAISDAKLNVVKNADTEACLPNYTATGYYSAYTYL